MTCVSCLLARPISYPNQKIAKSLVPRPASHLIINELIFQVVPCRRFQEYQHKHQHLRTPHVRQEPPSPPKEEHRRAGPFASGQLANRPAEQRTSDRGVWASGGIPLGSARSNTHARRFFCSGHLGPPQINVKLNHRPRRLRMFSRSPNVPQGGTFRSCLNDEVRFS
jgi:hypothetical protein